MILLRVREQGDSEWVPVVIGEDDGTSKVEQIIFSLLVSGILGRDYVYVQQFIDGEWESLDAS